MKLPASFRLTDSCTFLLAPPRGSPSQKTAFCSFSPKSSLTHSPLSTASCQWPGQVSRHYHRTGAEGKDSLCRAAAAAAQGWYEAWGGDGVCKSLTVPALETRRARFLNLSSGRPSLTQGALPGGMCQCHQPSLLQNQSSGIREQLTLPILQKNQKVPSPPRKKKS